MLVRCLRLRKDGELPLSSLQPELLNNSLNYFTYHHQLEKCSSTFCLSIFIHRSQVTVVESSYD